MTAPALLVDSVTGVDVTLSIAGPGARSYAFIIDWLIRTILAVAWYVLAAVVYHRGWILSSPLSPGTAWFTLVVAPPAAIYFLYHPLLETLTRGRTPGKRLAGVQLVDERGAAASVGALLTRNVFRLVDSLPVAYVVGLVTVMATRNCVRVGDLAAGTFLVYVRGEPALSPEPLMASRSALWQSAVARMRRLAAQRRLEDVEDAMRLPDDYRLLAHDVAVARLLLPESRTHAYLESAYAQSHSVLHRSAWNPGQELLNLFRNEIPAAVQWLRPYLLWTTALFVLAVLAGYWLVRLYPDLISLFASPDLIASVERGQLWTEGLLNILPSSVLSLQILTNNIVVSLFAYCAGFLFGLGTLYILGLNGLMLGAVFAFTSQHRLAHALLQFMVAHGCVEISVMCLSGAAGAAVGEALVRPAAATRAAAFRDAALRSGKVLVACVVLLIGAGLLEGYISPDPDIPLWEHVAIGIIYWLFMVALLSGWLLGGPRGAASSHATGPP